ncbi:MFS transporter [Anaerobacillus sp. MEB173]|uniref:MFS transporter n=1 Tax=Anaerobacillus sp. MEB173 TaxID=3383345 RepID=UPI003F9161D2
MKQYEKSFYSKTSMYAFVVVLAMVFIMWVATNQFAHMKLAQMGYIIGSFVFAIGITVRMCSWLIRPATKQVVKRSIQNMKQGSKMKRNYKAIFKTLVDNIILQKFIFKRGTYRGIMHWLIAWGCLGSFAITFGLVFGLFRFDLVDPHTYQMIVFGFPTITMSPTGILAQMAFNGLNITALLLLIGLIMALIRRTNNKNLAVTQRVEFDLVPLFMLLAVTVTGLVLTVSYKFMGGWMHHNLTIIHQAVTVVFLIYFPFGKLFHLPIRPLATAVPMNYQEVLQVDTRPCKSCQKEYSSDAQIEDVKGILGAQAFDLQMEDGSYLADYCPACRRRMRVMKQMNMEGPQGDPFGPVQTNNGFHISGFGKKRSDDFYNLNKKEQKSTEEKSKEEVTV